MLDEPNPLKLEAQARNRPSAPQPPRRPGSVRRTSSQQAIWTMDRESGCRIFGRARDLATGLDGDAMILGEDRIETRITGDGRIAAFADMASAGRLDQFAGLRPGGELRKALAVAMPEEERRETRLFRLLDDLAGAVFMSVAAWYAWDGGIQGHAERTGSEPRTSRPVEGVCLSYIPGSPVMTADGRGIDENADHPWGAPAVPTSDALGFHELVETADPNEWRLRRTDLWREAEDIVVDAWFQDSSGIPGEEARRVIFHEYGLAARFDGAAMTLRSISVMPHVLPYVTCHAAPATAQALIGCGVADLRRQVLARLRGTAGCTHLNDMLRALQDIGGLSALLSD
ncbi:DUF2889 domain-containing protein [Sphingobium sp. R-21]|uniref:DUF2889 domain-containing protein n=1 Tax=Sphingobium sp. R-21 TaxID=3404056 RepID=UPI003CE7DAB8